jgi:hypothetical protein
VEPRGLEPLTPCLQSDGVDLAKPRSGALSVGGEPPLYSADQRALAGQSLLRRLGASSTYGHGWKVELDVAFHVLRRFSAGGGCRAESFGSTASVLCARHFRPALGLEEKKYQDFLSWCGVLQSLK